MRQLLVSSEPQSLFPGGQMEETLDWGSPLAAGIHSLWLPHGADPRVSYNAAHLNPLREDINGEYTSAYYRRRLQFGPSLASLQVPSGSGGNVATPFGRAFAYSSEHNGLSVGSLGTCPMYSGDGSGKVISVCVWFRINRVNSTGMPTMIANSFSNTWWLGLRGATGKYKAIFRTSSSPYGAFEWGSYAADYRKLNCVGFTLPMDAGKTASVYHNGVLAVQGTLSNASGVSGNVDVWALSTSTPGMFVEIFGFAAWTRALYPEEFQELALGPWSLLARNSRFWYLPLVAYRQATIHGDSKVAANAYRGVARSAVIAGESHLVAYRRPVAAPERTLGIRAETRNLALGAEPRILRVPAESRRIDA
jgi:hypothetical protein